MHFLQLLKCGWFPTEDRRAGQAPLATAAALLLSPEIHRSLLVVIMFLRNQISYSIKCLPNTVKTAVSPCFIQHNTKQRTFKLKTSNFVVVQAIANAPEFRNVLFSSVLFCSAIRPTQTRLLFFILVYLILFYSILIHLVLF